MPAFLIPVPHFAGKDAQSFKAGTTISPNEIALLVNDCIAWFDDGIN
jgi:hypothetical protein